MQVSFFGTYGPSGSFPPPSVRSTEMTATAIMYTQFGFAVAADGRQRWENQATRDEYVRQSESETTQKIFSFTRGNTSLAYVVRGHIANRDRSFDMGFELQNQLDSWRFGDANLGGLLQRTAVNLETYIKTAQRNLQIEDLPTTFMDLLGYIGTQPFWVELQFQRVPNPRTGRLFEINSRPLPHGFCIVSGSLIIRDLIWHGQFSEFCDTVNYRRSLQDAIRFVKGYIDACCSPMALQFDPTCEEFGGHVHAATIVPMGGFRWAPGLGPIT
jgi:hypothetical protein